MACNRENVTVEHRRNLYSSPSNTEMGGACSTHKTDDKCMKHYSWQTWRENIDCGRRVLLWNLIKYDVDWMHLAQNMGPVAVSCEDSNAPLCSVKGGKFFTSWATVRFLRTLLTVVISLYLELCGLCCSYLREVIGNASDSAQFTWLWQAEVNTRYDLRWKSLTLHGHVSIVLCQHVLKMYDAEKHKHSLAWNANILLSMLWTKRGIYKSLLYSANFVRRNGQT
jgi:hypothetical protein